jgi:7 transmembrane receptor (rhodopsin family)
MTSSAATVKQRQQIVDFGATSAYVSAEDISGKPMVDTGNGDNWVRTVSVERAAAETGVLVMVWVVAVLGNTLVCIVINRSRRLQSTTNYFVVSLAAADLVLSLIVCPFAAAQVSHARIYIFYIGCNMYV